MWLVYIWLAYIRPGRCSCRRLMSLCAHHPPSLPLPFPHHQDAHPDIELQVQLESEASCLSLNVDGSGAASSSVRPAAAQYNNNVDNAEEPMAQAGTWSVAEAGVVRAACGPLQRRVVKGISSSSGGGMLTLKLS